MPDFLYDWPVWIAGFAIFLVLLFFAEVCLFLVRRHALTRVVLGAERDSYRGVMIQSMMLFYGLVAALLSVNVYQTYSDVMRIVSKEASSLAALYRDASGYPEPARSRLQGTIRDYTSEIIDEAWPMQRRGRIPLHGVEMVDSIQTELMSFEPVSEGQKLLHGETLRAFNVMVDARRLRLDANRDGLPKMMWVILMIGATLCLFGACFFEVEDARLHYLFQGLLAALVAMILFMTFAWDRPYRGELGVSVEPYQLIYDHLMRPH